MRLALDGGTLSLSQNGFDVAESDGLIQIPVIRADGSDGAVSLDYTTVNGTAVGGDDFTAASGQLDFSGGQTQAFIEIPIINDADAEGDEYFTLSIDNVQGGATLGAPRTAVINIVDDESASGQSLVGHWKFDDGQGMFAADAQGLRTGLLRNMEAGDWVSGVQATALQFDGANEYVEISHAPAYNLTTQITLAAWIKPAALESGDGIISKGTGASPYALNLGDAGRLRFLANWNAPAGSVGGGVWESSFVLQRGTWQHVAATYDGATLKFYLNGIEDPTAFEVNLRFGTNAEALHVGADLPGANEYFQGTIDDVRIYGAALTAGELATVVDEIPPASGSFAGETVVVGLSRPAAIDFASDGRMWIAQQDGVVRVYENGQLRGEPFIDIRAQVNNVRDRGLLGLAVHPNFPTVPYVYLLFAYDPPETQGQTGLAAPDQSGNRVSRLIRVTADPATGYNTAIAGTEFVLLGRNSTWENISRPDADSTGDVTIPSSCGPDGTIRDCIPLDSQSHAVGNLAFGADGSLFVAIGDGTSYGRVDPRSVRVQNLDSLSGKLLRIHPGTGEGYANNPFYNGDAGANRSKVYSYGLRNPFRFAVHPESGEPYIGDVGWTTWEEINVGRGANFGWPYFEGGDGQSLPTGGYNELPEAQAFYASGAPVNAPLWSRAHADGFRAIIAGDFYTGDRYPAEYRQTLFFTDFDDTEIRALTLNDDGAFRQLRSVGDSVGFLVEMTMGPDGYMYYANYGAGEIGRLVFTPHSDQVYLVPDGNTLYVYGTRYDDTIAYDAKEPYAIDVNGEQFDFGTQITRIEFYAGEGDDDISLAGSPANDRAVVRPDSFNVTAGGFKILGYEFESITVAAGPGGDDIAWLYDSDGDDEIDADRQRTTMTGAGYESTVEGFPRIFAYASLGTNDVARLEGGAGDDALIAYPAFMQMSGSGYYYYASGFDRTFGHAKGTGNDYAYFYDGPGDDHFTTTEDFSQLVGEGFFHYITGFDRVHAYASAGGDDRAQLYDTSRGETLTVRPDSALLTSNRIYTLAVAFERANVFAIEGGYDRAVFYDSAGNETLTGSPEFVALAGDNFYSQATGFDHVTAYADNGGEDHAHLTGSDRVDRFIATPAFAQLWNSRYFLYVGSFDVVSAVGTAGGVDRAYLYDSAGQDESVVTPDYTRLSGNGFSNTAYEFERVFLYATAGTNDAAYLYDSAGDDKFVSQPDYVVLEGSGFSNYAAGFDRVFAYASSGFDKAYFYDTPADDLFFGRENYAYFLNASSRRQIVDFDEVFVYRKRSGQDILDVSDVDYVFHAVGNWLLE